MQGRVNIISVNYNSAQDLLHCLESVDTSSYPHFQYLIVDNHSPDNSLNEIKQGCARLGKNMVELSVNELQVAKETMRLEEADVVLIRNDRNSGFGAGNNIILQFLIDHRPDEYAWLLNPDMEIEPMVMQDLVELSQQTNNALIGNLIHYYKKRDEVMYCGGFRVKKYSHGIENITSEKDRDRIDAIAGASMFAPVSGFKELGLLPEDYFMYWEETDYCTQARQKDYHFEVNIKSKLYDRVGASSKSNFTREYLYLLNGLRFYRKYYPWHLPLILASTFAKQLKSMLFEDRTKRKAIWAGHIDFFKLVLGRPMNPLDRIKRQ